MDDFVRLTLRLVNASPVILLTVGFHDSTPSLNRAGNS